jgi:hypothetical protein
MAQPAGLGGIVRHSYYALFSGAFHAKDDFIKNINLLCVRVGGGCSAEKDLGIHDQGPGDA